MKIIYIATSESIHSARWIKYFALKNKIIWITTSQPNKETIKEYIELKKIIKIYNIKKLKHLIVVIKLLLLGNYSLVHLHYLGWHSLITLFMRPKTNLIVTPWGSDLLLNNNFLKKVWLKFLFKKSNYTICDSERLKNNSIRLGAKKDKILVSMFGIDTKSYKATRSIFSNRDKIIVGSNRKFETIYDIKTLLYSAKSICKKRDDIIFHLAGDGSLQSEINNYIKEEKLNNKVFLLGLLNKEEMISFYNSIDIYVSTSLSDGGLSSSVAEAMAFERLVVVANNSDNSIWIKNKQNGYLFENKAHNELKEIS